MNCVIKHLFAATAAAIVSIACLSSCGDPHDISLKSYDVTSLTPNGLRGLGAVLSLEIENPSVKLKVSDISGSIHQGEAVVAGFVAGDFVLKGHSTQTYPVSCTLTLDKGTSLLDVLSVARKFKSDDLQVDISAIVSHGPVKKTVTKKGISVKSLIDN